MVMILCGTRLVPRQAVQEVVLFACIGLCDVELHLKELIMRVRCGAQLRLG